MRQSSLAEFSPHNRPTLLGTTAQHYNLTSPTSQLRLSLEISDDKLEEKRGKGIDKRNALRFTRPQMLGTQYFIAVVVGSLKTLKHSRTS